MYSLIIFPFLSHLISVLASTGLWTQLFTELTDEVSHLVSCSTFKRQHTADLVSPELCTCWPAKWLLWKSKDNHQLLPFCLTGSTDLHLRSAAAVHAACSSTLRTLTEDANTWKFWVVLGQTHTSRSLGGKKNNSKVLQTFPTRLDQPSHHLISYGRSLFLCGTVTAGNQTTPATNWPQGHLQNGCLLSSWGSPLGSYRCSIPRETS